LVKSKFFFQVVFSVIILFITGIIGSIFYHPSTRVLIIGFVEAIFLILALGSIALTIGFKGADFTAARRARMIRQEWSLISMGVCLIAGVAILAAFLPYLFNMFLPGTLNFIPTTDLNLAISTVISGIIASVVTAVFYKINLNSAKELIRKAET